VRRRERFHLPSRTYLRRGGEIKKLNVIDSLNRKEGSITITFETKKKKEGEKGLNFLSFVTHYFKKRRKNGG